MTADFNFPYSADAICVKRVFQSILTFRYLSSFFNFKIFLSFKLMFSEMSKVQVELRKQFHTSRFIAFNYSNCNWSKKSRIFLKNTNAFRDLHFGISCFPLSNGQSEKYTFEIFMIRINSYSFNTLHNSIGYSRFRNSLTELIQRLLFQSFIKTADVFMPVSFLESLYI